MLNSTEGSCLRSDFQVFIDPLAGRIYHIDFDRCFQWKKQKLGSWGRCTGALKSYVECLIQSRGGSAPKPASGRPAYPHPDYSYD